MADEEVDPLENARIVAEAFAIVFDKRKEFVCGSEGGGAALAKASANIVCAMIENDLLGGAEDEEESED